MQTARIFLRKVNKAAQIEARCREKDMQPYEWVRSILERYRTNFVVK
jgi:hypothetical protein